MLSNRHQFVTVYLKSTCGDNIHTVVFTELFLNDSPQPGTNLPSKTIHGFEANRWPKVSDSKLRISLQVTFPWKA